MKQGETARQSQGGLLQRQTVHICFMITYKLLSSLHKRRNQLCCHVHLLATPRSHGPSQERRRISHIITSWHTTKIYLVQDQVAPEHIWGPQNTSRVLSTKVQDQGSTQAFKQGFLGTHPGALEHIQGITSSTTKEHIQRSIQALRKDSLEHIQGPYKKSRDLVLDP